MPQFRGGNPYFFRENLYQSVYFIDVSRHFSRDSHREAVCKKIATMCNKNRQPGAKTRCHRTKNWSRRNWSFTSRGATVADIGQSRPTRDDSSRFWQFSGKRLVVTMIKLSFRYTYSTIWFSEICLKSVSLGDTAVSSKKGKNPYWIRTIPTSWWHVC